jgi:hypothetical protein
MVTDAATALSLVAGGERYGAEQYPALHGTGVAPPSTPMAVQQSELTVHA